MELRDYFGVLRRRWATIVALVVVAVGIAAAFTFTAQPQYASSARLFISTAQADTALAYQGGAFSEQRVTSYAELVSSRQLAEGVINDLALTELPEDLSTRATAEVSPETVMLRITIEDSDPARAQLLAQSYAENFIDLVRELETPEGKNTAPVKATIIDPASKATDPVSPQPVRNLGLALIVGLLLGVGIALLREVLDTTIKSADDLERFSGAPLLGAIAHDSNTRTRPLVTSLDSHAPRVESFRVLRTNIQFVDVDRQDKIFVITSAVPGEGKTTTSVNLAITLAQAGQRTLLIECDLRRPKAAETLGLDNAVGVTTVLLGRISLEDAIQKHGPTDLHVLASGAIPPNPAELLQSRAMADLLASLREQYDLIIVDAPPLLPVTDSALLAVQSDGAILVVRHGRTTRDQVALATGRLESVDAKLLGTVLNMVPAGSRRYGYGGYGYGYGYGYGPDQGQKAKKPEKQVPTEA